MDPKSLQVSSVVEASLECFVEMERRSDAVPADPRNRRRRTGLTCCAEFRDRAPSQVENAITSWLAEMLRERGFQARHPKRYEPSAKLCDLYVALDGFELWAEAKPIWSDWISEGPSGDRVRDHAALSQNIGQLSADADKLARLHPVPGDFWGLLAYVFQWDDRHTERVVAAIGPDWDHRRVWIPDLSNEPGEHFGCTPIFFFRPCA
jgi:hypothetical protein